MIYDGVSKQSFSFYEFWAQRVIADLVAQAILCIPVGLVQWTNAW